MSSTDFYLEEGTTYLEDEILIEQPSTQVVLHTEEKYINNDISLNLNVKSGSATTPTTTITSNPTIAVDSNGLITASYNSSKNITPTVSAGWVSSGTAGTVSTSGSNTKQLTTKAAATYNTSTSDQTIASGTYLTGTQTIRKITTSGISAANIKSGTTIKVGDAGDDDRIAGVTGTFTSSSTVSSGQTAAAAAQIRSGYSAWVNGTEIKGSIANGTITNNTSGGTSSGTINRGSQIKIGAGYYASDTYYTAQSNSGTLTIDTSKNKGTISVNGYANVNITGINIPKPSSGTNTFQIKVPNGENDTITFTFTVDSDGNTTIN